jgi:hypothetical protein
MNMKANISSTAGEDGAVVFQIEGRLPAPTISENAKFPWSPWQVGYQQRALEKAAENVLLAASNLAHVKATVENRAKERSERRALERAAVLREQLAAVEAAGSQPTAAVPVSVAAEAAGTQQAAASGGAPSGRARSAGGRRRRG